MVIEQEKSNVYDIAIVIPTYNEEKGIGPTIKSVKEALDGKFSYIIVVVDGLSTDRTVEIAQSMGCKLIFQRRKGYGDALQAGFHFVDTRLSTNITVMLDADGTYEPEDIVKMSQIIQNGKADFVIGNRFSNMDKEAMNRINRIGNKILSFISRKLLKINVSDSQCGLRAFRSDISNIMYTRSLGMPFATEMLTAAKEYQIKIKEIPTSYYSRIGETKLNPIQDGTRILTTIIRLMRDTRPLALFGSIGSFLFVIGLFFGAEVLVEYFQTGKVIRIPTAVMSALFMVLGVQTISLGLISDMIKGRNHDTRIFYNE